jgi:hypothetical protein
LRSRSSAGETLYPGEKLAGWSPGGNEKEDCARGATTVTVLVEGQAVGGSLWCRRRFSRWMGRCSLKPILVHNVIINGVGVGTSIVLELVEKNRPVSRSNHVRATQPSDYLLVRRYSKRRVEEGTQARWSLLGEWRTCLAPSRDCFIEAVL